MKASAVVLSAAALLAASSLSLGVGAAVGTPTTYSNLVWNAVWAPPITSVFVSCGQLKLDSTGDVVNSNTMALHGSLICQATANTAAHTLGATGTAYFSPDAQFNMSLLLGNGVVLQCTRWGSTSGTCSVSDPAGSTNGSVQLTMM
jgi:hypothetical protein